MSNHRTPRGGALATAIVLLALGVAAQGTKKYESPRHGFRLKVPDFVKEQPLEPLEQQILVKLQGSKAATLDGDERELQLRLLVVRIHKRKAAATGPREGGPAPQLESVQDRMREHLNGGTTLEEFLQRHDLVSQRRLKNELTKPVKSKDGHQYLITEVSSNADARLAIRAFTLEDEQEIFGLVAIGVGAVQAFHAQILTAAQSLERIPIEASAAPVAASTAAAGELRDPDRRAQVRRDLVAGWKAWDTDNFIVVSNVPGEATIRKMLVDLEAMRNEYERQLPPLAPLTAVSTVRVCANVKEFHDYAGAEVGPGTIAYWHPVHEELVLFDPDGKLPASKRLSKWLEGIDAFAVLYHEAMHQYLHYANGQVPPASWFNEGMGEVFGGAKVDRGRGVVTRIDKNPTRMPFVKQMQKQRSWPDLRRLLEMTKAEFYGGSALQNYAMGWAFCWFLRQEGQKKAGRREEWAALPVNYLANLRAAAAKVRSKLPDDAPGDWISAFQDEIQKDAFEATFGKMDLAALEKAWISAMERY